MILPAILIMACGKGQIIEPKPVVKICPKQARPVLSISQDLTINQIAENYEAVVKSYLQLEETVKCLEESEK